MLSDMCVCCLFVFVCLFVQLAVVTTDPTGPGNSGISTFLLANSRVYAQHCRDVVLIKAMPKALLKLQHTNAF